MATWRAATDHHFARAVLASLGETNLSIGLIVLIVLVILLLVAQHSDFDWLGQAVRLTPAEFWDQRGVRYCALSLATF